MLLKSNPSLSSIYQNAALNSKNKSPSHHLNSFSLYPTSLHPPHQIPAHHSNSRSRTACASACPSPSHLYFDSDYGLEPVGRPQYQYQNLHRRRASATAYVKAHGTRSRRHCGATDSRRSDQGDVGLAARGRICVSVYATVVCLLDWLLCSTEQIARVSGTYFGSGGFGGGSRCLRRWWRRLSCPRMRRGARCGAMSFARGRGGRYRGKALGLCQLCSRAQE